jgi:fused signal recognition particle receptor
MDPASPSSGAELAPAALDLLTSPSGAAALLLFALAVALVWALRAQARVNATVQATPQAQPPAASRRAPTGGFFASALARTREAFAAQLDRLRGRSIDESALEELEMALLGADVGMPTTSLLLEPLRVAQPVDAPSPLARLRDGMRGVLAPLQPALAGQPASGPLVILVVGVNGSGKTTTIGKLAARYAAEGKRVLLAAGDTFRAAAAEQLGVWAQRAGAEIVADAEGADPASVAYAALEAACAREVDVVIIDTAGRLQTAKPLMEQLGKMRRVIEKRVPGAPHETLLVLDGTIGQNALSQARLFHEATPLTGVAITKLDGTAKGGVVLAVASELRLPIKLVGLGERVEDLRDFDADAFLDALLPQDA